MNPPTHRTGAIHRRTPARSDVERFRRQSRIAYRHFWTVTHPAHQARADAEAEAMWDRIDASQAEWDAKFYNPNRPPWEP